MVHVTTLVLPTGTGSCHTKQIIIRNTTRQDIVLKIKSDAPRAIHFEAEKIVVDSRKYVVVNMVFNERELSSSPKGSESKVRIYARPVTKYNQECLRRWLTAENCEMTSQLAFLIELRLDNYIYSASKLILDLPGQASLVDPIPRAIQACVDEDCVTGINIDADTNTATVFDDKDYRLAVQLQEDHNASRHVTFSSIKVLLLKCAILAPIMDRLFPPAAQTTNA